MHTHAQLVESARKFAASEHIKNFDKADWTPLFDEKGNQLWGIRGKTGAVAFREDNEEIGVDLIEMQPGSRFPLHVHPGDHILLFLHDSAFATVTIDGVVHHVKPNDSIFIPAEYPHGVGTYPEETKPARFYAVGVPHKHVAAKDRMKIVEEGYFHEHPPAH